MVVRGPPSHALCRLPPTLPFPPACPAQSFAQILLCLLEGQACLTPQDLYSAVDNPHSGKPANPDLLGSSRRAGAVPSTGLRALVWSLADLVQAPSGLKLQHRLQGGFAGPALLLRFWHW